MNRTLTRLLIFLDVGRRIGRAVPASVLLAQRGAVISMAALLAAVPRKAIRTAGFTGSAQRLRLPNEKPFRYC